MQNPKTFYMPDVEKLTANQNVSLVLLVQTPVGTPRSLMFYERPTKLRPSRSPEGKAQDTLGSQMF